MHTLTKMTLIARAHTQAHDDINAAAVVTADVLKERQPKCATAVSAFHSLGCDHQHRQQAASLNEACMVTIIFSGASIVFCL